MRLTGIQSGALLQRVNGSCETVLHTENIDALECSHGTLSKLAPDTWLLTGIPVGGPYSVTFSATGGDSISFENIYVGDLWLLAGQSNMEGAGWLRKKDEIYAENPNPDIRAFYMEEQWRPALSMLHQLWKSCDVAHCRTFAAEKENVRERGLRIADFPPAPQKRGVGPGLFFADALYHLTGVPQGLIPCAVGGAPIEMWIPTEDGDNYYTAAYRRIIACGQRIRGIFWYQGEGFSGSKEEYQEKFEKMRQGFSALCGTADLPAVMVQTFQCTIPGTLHSIHAAYVWSAFRNYLLDICREGKNLTVVASNDLELDDCIHLSADAQEKLGKRAADAMLYLTEGVGCGEPEIASITIHPHACVTDWSELRIKYRNLRGQLTSVGFPGGFMIAEGEEAPSVGSMQHISLSGDEVRIRFELTEEQLRRKKLWYGFGLHFHCSIVDEGGHPLLSQGPISLEKDFHL